MRIGIVTTWFDRGASFVSKQFMDELAKDNNDIFLTPIDIADNTIPNGNAIMLINLIRLGLKLLLNVFLAKS